MVLFKWIMHTQSTRHTRLVECNDFVILEWTKGELIQYEPCKLEYNYRNSLSRCTGCIKYHEHMDIMMHDILLPFHKYHVSLTWVIGIPVYNVLLLARPFDIVIT